MRVFLNGNFVPEAQAVVSVFDRSFLYGDGLFETMLIANSVPFRWTQHFARLERGAEFLKIVLPFSGPQLREFALQLIGENKMSRALLRLSLSRGVGIRGYSPRGADTPTVVMSLHAAPDLDPKQLAGWKLATSTFRLPARTPGPTETLQQAPSDLISSTGRIGRSRRSVACEYRRLCRRGSRQQFILDCQ